MNDSEIRKETLRKASDGMDHASETREIYILPVRQATEKEHGGGAYRLRRFRRGTYLSFREAAISPCSAGLGQRNGYQDARCRSTIPNRRSLSVAKTLEAVIQDEEMGRNGGKLIFRLFKLEVAPFDGLACVMGLRMQGVY
jgi:hypothetical protein